MHFSIYSGELDFAARTANHEWILGWDVPESRLHSPVHYGQWNHVVVTRRGDSYTMWMNGARINSETSPAQISDTDNTNPFLVGGMMEDDGGAICIYQGSLDDFRIFRRCLSDKEIDALYSSGGDETAIRGEGRVKFGPLIALETKNVPHPRALQFDGEHYAKVDPPPKFTSADFTISLWLNPVRTETTAYPFMRGLGYRDQRGDIGLMLHRTTGELAFDANTGGNSRWLFGWDGGDSPLRSPVHYGQWNHVVVTRRGETSPCG